MTKRSRLVSDASGSGSVRQKSIPLKAIIITQPSSLKTPVIYASPHSGRSYSPEFLNNSRLDHHALRQSEDSYVDLLFECAPKLGAPLLTALFPRAFVDVNRSRDELDPRMFTDQLPINADTRSTRVRAGLGVIPRIVSDGHDIYARKLKFSETSGRLLVCYDPYHNALKRLVSDAYDKFGCAIVVDCHSMPSAGVAPLNNNERPVDFVLGDRFGVSCAPSITHLFEHLLVEQGFSVTRNTPYAGGYVASAYGRPNEGVHVIQVEINRALYLDEVKIARNDHFDKLKTSIEAVMMELSRIEPSSLIPARAAE